MKMKSITKKLDKLTLILDENIDFVTEKMHKYMDTQVSKKLRNYYLGKVTGDLYAKSGVAYASKGVFRLGTTAVGFLWDSVGGKEKPVVSNAYLKRYRAIKKKYPQRTAKPEWIGKKKRPFLRDTIKQSEKVAQKFFKEAGKTRVR